MCDTVIGRGQEVREITKAEAKNMQAINEQNVLGAEVNAHRWLDFWIGLGVLTSALAGVVWLVRIML